MSQNDVERDAARYRWWRENIDAIVDDEGMAGVAYSYQIPLADLQRLSDAELMDAIADIGLADPPSNQSEGE